MLCTSRFTSNVTVFLLLMCFVLWYVMFGHTRYWFPFVTGCYRLKFSTLVCLMNHESFVCLKMIFDWTTQPFLKACTPYKYEIRLNIYNELLLMPSPLPTSTSARDHLHFTDNNNLYWVNQRRQGGKGQNLMLDCIQDYFLPWFWGTDTKSSHYVNVS